MAKKKEQNAKNEKIEYRTTKDIKVSDHIVDQVIGQDEGVKIIKKAAQQRRHVLLIGEPGTGKSMLGLALAELLPKEKLVDVMAFPNPNDDNQPLIRTMPAGQGREFVARSRLQGLSISKNLNLIMTVVLLAMGFYLYYAWKKEYFVPGNPTANAIIYASVSVTLMIVMVGIMLSMSFGKRIEIKAPAPKVIVDNYGKKQAPFLDATGAHAGALLGDVLHDPFQSGGLGTPPHERVVAGMIHKAHMGVLFIDEIATLEPSTQQELLTSVQEGKYAITGQSERSAGAMVRTEPVPCAFIMVAAGNLETIRNLHPALRSRIRGYGYEVYMETTMPDNEANRQKIAVFVAQEIKKDGRIPPFTREAVYEIIEEAKRRADRKNHLTLRLRELGGLVRAAGDLAVEEKVTQVDASHVTRAKYVSRTLEKQIADKVIDFKKEYNVIRTTGTHVGRVNGLAVMTGGGPPYSGMVMPIEAEVTFGGDKTEVFATGKLGEIAKESVTNVSALVKKLFGEDLKGKYDIYIQFLQTYEGTEGDSASIAMAIAIISALKKIPVKQDTAMTGSLSVRGEVLPVGGVTSKVEAVIEAGLKHVIVPKANLRDIIIPPDKLAMIEVIPVENINEVLEKALDWTGKKDILKKINRYDE